MSFDPEKNVNNNSENPIDDIDSILLNFTASSSHYGTREDNDSADNVSESFAADNYDDLIMTESKETILETEQDNDSIALNDDIEISLKSAHAETELEQPESLDFSDESPSSDRKEEQKGEIEDGNRFRSTGNDSKAKKNAAKASAKAEKDRLKSERKAAKREALLQKEEEKRLAKEEKKAAKLEIKRATADERRKSGIALIIFAVVIFAVAGTVFFFGNKISKSDKTMPNLCVGEIPLGKMTKEETVKALETGGWEEKTTTPLTVTTIGGVTFDVDPLKSGVVISGSSAADAAYKIGHDGNIFENLATYLKCSLHPIDINKENSKPDFEYINNCISEGKEKISEYMGKDEYTVDLKTGSLVMKKGWSQIRFSDEDFRNEIVRAIKSGSAELTYTTLATEPSAPDFDKIHRDLEREPKDAYYTDDGKFNVIDEVVGCKFSVDEAKKIWDEAVTGSTVTIPVEVIYPEITGEMLRSRLYHDLLGAMTTKYTNSAEQRCSNVRLAASKINGYILYPGEVFSYNEVVGERTEEAGFQPAPAYVNGEVKDEIGGGACQVSSTLYAATVFGFLDTVERECHYYPVNYMQLGTDATVTIPTDGGSIKDFKFRNNNKYPVKIVSYTEETEEEKKLTFEIWGTLEENAYMPIEFDNSYSWTQDYDRKIDPAYPDRKGYKIKLTHEQYGFSDDIGDGTRTLTHREVYDSEGNLVEDKIINQLLPDGNPAMDTYYRHP